MKQVYEECYKMGESEETYYKRSKEKQRLASLLIHTLESTGRKDYQLR
jgi:hypothetical protein